MRGGELAEAMAAAVDRLVNAREGINGLDRAIETVVNTMGRFNGRDSTSYLDAYKAEMLMRNIPEDRRLTGFPRVVTPSIHTEVLEIQADCRNWEEFEERIFEKYGLDDSLRISKMDLMEWVELPGKGRNTTTLLQEFERRFARLSALDRTVLDTSKVLLFIKAVDSRDREKVGLLLETDDGLTTDWAMVKRVCSRFDKRREWNDGSPSSGQTSTNSISETHEPKGGRAPQDREQANGRFIAERNVVEAPSGGSAIDELTKMVRDLQIAQARRENGGPQDRRPPFAQRCMWCDSPDHLRRECGDFQEALRRNIVYLWNNRVYSTETRRPLGLNQGQGGMRRLMEEAEARHVEAIHCSVSAGIRVGKEVRRQEEKEIDFWPSILGSLSRGKFKREEADEAERRVQEATGWKDPVEEKTGIVEAACQNYEVMVEEKKLGNGDGAGPSRKYDARGTRRREETNQSQARDERWKEKGNPPNFKLCSEIEQATDLKKVVEERILDSRVEFTLREVLGIAKKEFHEVIIDLMKRKRLSTEQEVAKPAMVNALSTEVLEEEEDYASSHYTRPHWARATTETPVRVGDVKEPVVALIDHGSEINLMSMDFYKKGKWPLNTKHGWKIRAATRATEELYGACPNVRVKVGDVEIDQHFFVQETSSHPVILGEPYITAARMETKVLDNGSAYARVKSQDGKHSVQFLTVRPNHERNRASLRGENREDF